MPKPRIFVSSTFYDLRHIRSSLEVFISSIGYDPVLSEKGVIAFNPDIALDESCYKEAAASDVLVLIVGGRYGSEASGNQRISEKDFFVRYESITKKEYESAVSADIPIYILIESAVYAEYNTFLKNRDNKTIKYAYVDSVNVFHFIDFILSQPRNNPVFGFERYADIEGWLREQWSGLFRDMLKARSGSKQIAALQDQVNDLKLVSNTLKNYLEILVKRLEPDQSGQIIIEEENKIRENRLHAAIKSNEFFEFISELSKNSEDTLLKFLRDNNSKEKFTMNLNRIIENSDEIEAVKKLLVSNKAAIEDFNELMNIINKKL